MKKIATAMAAASLFSLAAHADFTRVEVGGGVWQAEPSGPVTYDNGTIIQTVDIADNLGFDEEDFTYVWLNIKHPIPVLPNLRIEKVDVDYSGTATQDFTFVYNNATYTYSADTVSSLQIDQTDIILYYNLLDDTAWMTFDLGIDVKLMDFTIDIRETSGEHYTESEEIPLPMLYARGRVGIPGTDLAIEGDVKYVGYNDSTVYDARIKVDYTFDITPVVQPALEIGYRIQKLEIDEDDLDVKTDIEFSGMYAGLMLRF